MLDTKPLLIAREFPAIKRQALEILQVNLGYLCNLSCTHCHVNAGPRRTELMDEATIQLVLDVIKSRGVKTLDLTGGAPEMNPHFRYLVTEARKLGCEVIDRCNITILSEPGYEDLAQFLADQKVKVVASLPCYTQENVDAQRGKGVFDSSIKGLHDLNALGFGKAGTGLELDLVYNPGGAFLPPSQQSLEQDYKQRLMDDWGIEFNQLYTITNMPISRFGSMLVSKGQFNDYMQLLIDNYHEKNLDTVMCRNTVSVDYQGYLYDCDFNQMLAMPCEHKDHSPRHIQDLLSSDLAGENIVVAGHCFGCTAGAGSSCGGALS
ncbi:MAG: arsenosugar biosynthesis radical SAM protein ArsS [Gammaproteobacteria bacterium]|nr:arsenosugar biosynthesis radical SAM protein ArsS [Gammaproteobacteria bacterium]